VLFLFIKTAREKNPKTLVSDRRSNRIRAEDADAKKDCLNAKYPWYVDDSDNILSLNDRLKFAYIRVFYEFGASLIFIKSRSGVRQKCDAIKKKS